MQQTLEKLRSLRLPGFIAGLAEQSQSKHYRDLTFEERLAFLVEKECSRRANQRLASRLKQARLRQSATLDQVDFAVARGLVKSKFLELAQCDWICAHHNLMLLGPTGVGKSFLACVLGDQACKLGFTVLYTKQSQLLADLLHARADARSGPSPTSSRRSRCWSSMNGCATHFRRLKRARYSTCSTTATAKRLAYLRHSCRWPTGTGISQTPRLPRRCSIVWFTTRCALS